MVLERKNKSKKTLTIYLVSGSIGKNVKRKLGNNDKQTNF